MNVTYSTSYKSQDSLFGFHWQLRMYKCLLKTRVYTKIVFNLYNLQLYQYNINTEIAQPSANRSACAALPIPQIDN